MTDGGLFAGSVRIALHRMPWLLAYVVVARARATPLLTRPPAPRLLSAEKPATPLVDRTTVVPGDTTTELADA